MFESPVEDRARPRLPLANVHILLGEAVFVNHFFSMRDHFYSEGMRTAKGQKRQRNQTLRSLRLCGAPNIIFDNRIVLRKQEPTGCRLAHNRL